MNSFASTIFSDSYTLFNSYTIFSGDYNTRFSRKKEKRELIFACSRTFGRILVLSGIALNAKYLPVATFPGKLILVALGISAFVFSHDLFVLSDNLEEENFMKKFVELGEEMSKKGDELGIEIVKKANEKYKNDAKKTKNPLKKLFKKIPIVKAVKLTIDSVKQIDHLQPEIEQLAEEGLIKKVIEGTWLPIWRTNKTWITRIVNELYD